MAGALVALLVFLTWAAAAYAAVGHDPEPQTSLAAASATTELASGGKPLVRVAVMVMLGFVPAVFLIARSGRGRPTAELSSD